MHLHHNFFATMLPQEYEEAPAINSEIHFMFDVWSIIIFNLKFILNDTNSADGPCTLKTISFVANVAWAITFPITEVSANSINTAVAIIL